MAEKKVIELEVNSNLGNLKQQLKQAQVEVQTLSEKFGATSKQAVEAAKAAAILKDKIGDAKALTDAFNPDAKFKAVAGSLTGVAGGFSVVTGAMGAFGKQSEEVEKALLKVQSVMAITSGAQAIGESIDSFKQLGAVIKANSVYQGIYNFITTGSIKSIAQQTAAKISDTAATVAQGTAMSATTTATVGATVASKALRIALVTTGIGALIVGVGYLISKISEYSAKQKLNNEINQKAVLTITSELSAADKLAKALKNESLTREQKNIKVKEFQKQYPNLLSNINTEKNSIQEINKALTLNIQLLKLQAKQKAVSTLREKEFEKQLIAETNTVEQNAGTLVSFMDELLKFTPSGAFIDHSKVMAEVARVNKKTAISEADVRVSELDRIDAALQKDVDALKANGAVGEDQAAKNKEIADKAAAAAEKRAQAAKEAAEKRQAETEAAIEKAAAMVQDRLSRETSAIESAEDLKISMMSEGKAKQLAILDETYGDFREDLIRKANKDTFDIIEDSFKKGLINEEIYRESLKIVMETGAENFSQSELDLMNLTTTKLNEDKRRLLLSAQELELDDINKAFNQKDITEAQRLTQIQEINDKYANIEKEKALKEKAYLEELTLTESQLRIAKLTSQYEADQILYKDNKEILKALDIKYAKDKEVLENEDVARQKTINEKKIAMAMDGLSIINDLFQMNAGKSEKDARRAFKAQKAFNLASALTNTYLAVTSALATKVELFPGQRFIEAGLAGAAGAVQVAKIAKTQFEGGASSDAGSVGGGSGAPTMSAPQFNVVGQSGVNQLASLNQQPIQAYVVSGQVTSQQSLDRNRLANATLGG